MNPLGLSTQLSASVPQSGFGVTTDIGGTAMDTSNGTAMSNIPVSPAAMRSGVLGVRHQTMEFFELCTELITTLAR